MYRYAYNLNDVWKYVSIHVDRYIFLCTDRHSGTPLHKIIQTSYCAIVQIGIVLLELKGFRNVRVLRNICSLGYVYG